MAKLGAKLLGTGGRGWGIGGEGSRGRRQLRSVPWKDSGSEGLVSTSSEPRVLHGFGHHRVNPSQRGPLVPCTRKREPESEQISPKPGKLMDETQRCSSQLPATVRAPAVPSLSRSRNSGNSAPVSLPQCCSAQKTAWLPKEMGLDLPFSLQREFLRLQIMPGLVL